MSSRLCALRCVMTKASITRALARRSLERHRSNCISPLNRGQTLADFGRGLTALFARLFRLLAVEAERLEHRPVADREQDRVLGAGVGMGVLRPRGQRDDVALLPVEGLAVDHGAALALHDVEHRAAGDAAGLELLALSQHLHAAGHRW